MLPAMKKRGKVHFFEKFGRLFAFDLGSGVFSELDDTAWRLALGIADGLTLDEVRRGMPGAPDGAMADEAGSELQGLITEGVLFSPDPWNARNAQRSPALSSLCLMLAEDCNLRCDYCFVTGGKPAKAKRRMAEGTAKASVDFLLAQSRETKLLHLSYFGGEPMLNFPVLVETTRYALKRAEAEGREIRFNITTNATVVNDSVQDFLAAHPAVSLLLSLDGGTEIHDRHRRFPGGKGSFEAAASTLRRLLADERIGPKRLSVRGTFTTVNQAFTRAASELLALGARDISLEPAIVKRGELEINEDNLPAIKAEYDRLAHFFLEQARSGNPFSFFHFDRAMDQISLSEPVVKPCGAGDGYLAVSYDGSLFPCHRFVGDRKFRMGDVWQGLVNPELWELFRGVEVNGKEKCRECWAKYLCGGGCHRHAAEFNGSILEPYDIECELVKWRIEIAAYIFAVLTDEERKAIRGGFSASARHRPEFLQDPQCDSRTMAF